MQDNQKQALRSALASLAKSHAVVVEQIEQTIQLLTQAIDADERVGIFSSHATLSETRESRLISYETLSVEWHGDRGAARQLERQLKQKHIDVTLVRANDLDPPLLEDTDLIIIGWDTFPVWQSWKQSGQIVVEANLPEVAMGKGGFDFLGRLKLCIGAPEGVLQTSGSVRPVENTKYWIGFSKTKPAKGLYQVLTEPSYASVSLPEPVDGIIPIGKDPDNESLYSLVAQKPHYFLWGYTGQQDKMTETGKELLAWSCRYAASMNRRESK